MPLLVQWLLGGLGWALTSWAGKLLTTLGLSFVISTFVMPDWKGMISSNMTGPAFILAMAGFFKVDRAITIVLSAYATKAASKMVSGIRRGGSAPIATGLES